MPKRNVDLIARYGHPVCVYCLKEKGIPIFAPYRIGKEGSLRREVRSRTGVYCYEHSQYQLELYRTGIEMRRRVRFAEGKQTDEDVLIRLADEIKEWAVRRLRDAGRDHEADYLAGTPIFSNRAYTRVTGRAWYVGSVRRIEFALKYFKVTDNVSNGAFRNTILHEIAHMIDYAKNGDHERRDGHGPNWKAECEFFGSIPSRTFIGFGMARCGAPKQNVDLERIADAEYERAIQ